MPIRIWNTPGGPVRYGEDWTDLYDTLSEEEKRRLGLEQTELGRWVSKEEVGYGTRGPGANPDEWGDSMRGAALDMTSPRNRAAKAGVLSRGAKMPFYTDIEGVELDPMMREAQRLSTPWRGTQTLEIEPTLEEKLSGSRIHPKTYEISGEAMPAASELEMSSKIWQASQRPLATRAGEADIESSLATASKERGLASSYEADAAKKLLPSTPASPSFQEFAIKILPALKEYALDEGQLLSLLQKLYEQQYGTVTEDPRRAPFGPGGAGGDETGIAGELDRRYGG